MAELHDFISISIEEFEGEYLYTDWTDIDPYEETPFDTFDNE